MDSRKNNKTAYSGQKREQFETLVDWIRNDHSEPPVSSIAGNEGVWDWHSGVPVVDKNLIWRVFAIEDSYNTRMGVVAGKTPFGKAAVKEAAKREYVEKGIPEHFVRRALRVQFGRELLEHVSPEVWKAFDGCTFRPRITLYDNLSNANFTNWYNAVLHTKLSPSETGFTGPRAEAFVRSVLGEDWRKLPPIDPPGYVGFKGKENGKNFSRSVSDDGYGY